MIGVLTDPLVPLDFGGWFQRVVGLSRRNFGRLVPAAAIVAVLMAAYIVALVASMPSSEEIDRTFAEAGTPSGVGEVVTVFWGLGGQLAVTLLIAAVVFAVVGAALVGAALFVLVRGANGQPSTVGQGLRFSRGRVGAFIGWGLLAGLIMAVVLGLPVLPGLLVSSAPLAGIGAIVGAVLMLSVAVVAAATLPGVVMIEGCGVRRCLALIKGRFWASCGRLVVAGLIYVAYSQLVDRLVMGLLSVTGFTGQLSVGVVVAAILQAVLLIPTMVVVPAVVVVTYAELRYWEDRATSTRSLAAQLTG